jgi:hypothetical protein
MKGLEPSRLTARAPKARVYTNFTTSPNLIRQIDDNRGILLYFAVKNQLRIAIIFSCCYLCSFKGGISNFTGERQHR